jgi:hypothetical protein
MWDGSTACPIFEKWETSEGSKALLDAGFAKGESEFLKDALVCLQMMIARSRRY